MNNENIFVEFPDGKKKEFAAGTTPREILAGLGRSLAEKALVAKYNNAVIDLHRPLRTNGRIQFLTWEDEDGMQVYWHSTSHIMAHAIKEIFPEAQFGVGPPIEAGFYYDVDVETKLGAEQLARIEAKMQEIVDADRPFAREDTTKAEALQLFEKRGDKYKLELLRDLNDEFPSLYHEGDFVDLCRGPHLASTGRVRYFKLLSIAGAYWRGNEKNKMLQRIYGISFPKKEMLEQHLFMLEEAKRRDHRRLGQDLDLFFITPNVGGGLPLWLPKGTIVRETLEDFLRDEQRKRGYQPVVTPHIANLNLYKTSGHYPYYKDSQFAPIKVEDEEYLLKPMNCPHHHQIYMARPRSYRDLPLRLAEFGTVYRYEQSGELGGLTRVRGFTQDDAHIYCAHDQLQAEIRATVELTQLVFRTFDMDVRVRLSFRDDNAEKFGGDLKLWEQAQGEIKEVADAMGLNYFVGIGEASFYGPKIDFMIKDALGRTWQLGTVQVDYVMPERFGLEYVGSDNQKHRPVIIHRAPFGSLERFIAILIEHYAGAFPVWLAPVQAAVLSITDAQRDYAGLVHRQLVDGGVRCTLDAGHEKIGAKIRAAEVQKIPYMVIVGAREAELNTVSVRKHKAGDLGSMSREQFVATIKDDIQTRRLS